MIIGSEKEYIMTVYTFEVKGKPIYTVDTGMVPGARSSLGMVEANKHFGSLPQGAWMEDCGTNHFYWVEGNFFD